MAKVMISLPDELLAQLDLEVQQQQTTRSALIRAHIEATYSRSARELSAVMAQIDEEPVASHGGDVVADLKAARAALKR